MTEPLEGTDPGDEVLDRIVELSRTVPHLDSRIVGRLVERCPEVVAEALDAVERDGR